MAKPTKSATSKPAPRRRPGRKPRPKNQQATSVNAIIREHVKKLAGFYRLQQFNITQIADAINEAMGPEGEAATDTPELHAAFWKVHPKGVSRHHVHDLISEAIAEAVDPLTKQQLLDLAIQQHNALMAAMIGPALQGSTVHCAQYQSLFRDFAKLTKLIDTDEGNSAAITQIFLNGNLAQC